MIYGTLAVLLELPHETRFELTLFLEGKPYIVELSHEVESRMVVTRLEKDSDGDYSVHWSVLTPKKHDPTYVIDECIRVLEPRFQGEPRQRTIIRIARKDGKHELMYQSADVTLDIREVYRKEDM